jgi:hypothetical protein
MDDVRHNSTTTWNTGVIKYKDIFVVQPNTRWEPNGEPNRFLYKRTYY